MVDSYQEYIYIYIYLMVDDFVHPFGAHQFGLLAYQVVGPISMLNHNIILLFVNDGMYYLISHLFLSVLFVVFFIRVVCLWEMNVCPGDKFITSKRCT